MQPSAQGIASLYMGNPGALQQKVQKEQQAKPGIPPDLKQLMALNIVTNEQDAAKRQEAMNALSRMAPAGQPPTVAQSIQEQAKQKVQARMLQQAQQQQGLQTLMQQQRGAEVPPGTPQPEHQPQGIDELPVDMGEFAGGGIVAFQSRGDVPSQEEMEKQREEDRKKALELWEATKGTSEDIGRAIADIATLIPRGLVGAYDTAVVRPMRALGANAAYISPYLVPEGVNPSSMTPFSDVKRMREQSAAPAAPVELPTGAERIEPAVAQTAPATASAAPAAKPIADLRAAAEQRARTQQSPELKAALATPQAAPVQQSEYAKALAERMGAKPETARATATEAYKAAVPTPETTQIDRLIEELERRKGQYAAPKQGWDAFTEYMQQIAAAGPQRKWYEAGAKGAAGVQALEQERQRQQHEITKQQIEAAQKKADIGRAYAKETFAVGQAEYDRVFKDTMDALKESGLGERENRRLAQEAAEKAKDRVVHLEQSRIQASVHGMPTYSDIQKDVAIREWMDANPGKSRLDAMTALGLIGTSAEKQNLAELKTLQTSLQKQLENPMLKNKEKIEQQLESVNAQIAQMAGLAGGPRIPSVGTIEGGYKFKGGDPSKKENWEKV